MTGSRNFVIPVHLLNKLSDPPNFGYKTKICTLGEESNFGFLKNDHKDGRYTMLWTSTWEVVSSVKLHTTLRNASDPIHIDRNGTSMVIASSSSSSKVTQSVVCMEV
jgi:hypothetical protein